VKEIGGNKQSLFFLLWGGIQEMGWGVNEKAEKEESWDLKHDKEMKRKRISRSPSLSSTGIRVMGN